ncbi:MAG: carboxypeptidase-like regulatory domain-containing protein [Bacteroidetes bacterium]|nr:carboxypeptidase-like regulatory domain-containing protein [Bacteroidota bacterium]
MKLGIKPFLLIFCILIASQFANAFQLKGRVTSTNNKPVEFATVYVVGSTYGVATNLKGDYLMELKAGTYEISFSAIGYKTVIKQVSISDNSILNTVMEADVQQLGGVVISADDKDPAYAIIKHTQDNRKTYLNQFENAKCDVYAKHTYKHKFKSERNTDTSISISVGEPQSRQDQLIESRATYYQKPPNNAKEIKYAYFDHSAVGRRLDFGNSVDFGASFSPTEKYGAPQARDVASFLTYKNLADLDLNFYKNLVNIPKVNNKPYVSPIAATAFLSYHYKLIETFEEDGEQIHKIAVMPRRKHGNFFEGFLFVVEGKWCLKGVELSIPEGATGLYNDFKIFQNYADWNSKWVLVREELFYSQSNISEHKMGNSLVLYSEWEFDIDIEKGFFNNAITEYAEGATEVGPEFMSFNRPVTMNTEEEAYILKRDSTRTYLKSPEYFKKADSSYNHTGIWDFLFLGVGYRNSVKGVTYRFMPVLEQIRPFAVGGYRHALGGSIEKRYDKIGKAFDFQGQLDYGFLNNDLRGRMRLGYTYNAKKMAKIWVRAGSEYEILNSFESIAATFSRSNYILSNHITLGHEYEIINGVFLDLSLRYSHQSSIEDLKLSNWSNAIWGNSGLNMPEYFAPYTKLMFDNKVSIRFNQQYEMLPHTKIIKESTLPKLNIRHKWGVPTLLGSVVNFHYLEARLWDYISFGTAGYSKYNVLAGSFIRARSTEFVDDYFFRGSDRFFFSSPLLSLQLFGRSVNTKGPFLQANYVHHFNGAILNKIPLINKTRLETAVGAATMLDKGNNIVYTEAFAGIEWPFRLGGQLFKLGGYYVTAWNNDTHLDGTFKVGIDFFNSYTGRWTY